MSDNTFYIAEKIFSKPILPANSYCLEIDDPDTINILTDQGLDVSIQVILKQITIHGIEILFGIKDLSQLNSSNLNTLKLYVESFGYSLVITELQDSMYSYKFEKLYT